ncbi:hypothetical protein CDL12_15750 [Handroanthus impetiginosus]|uniref:Uncharacterized protein n=1 Tax=Handroanthus impetiginosus TaxID=429701 RepID=A0A2G9H2W6_9LAMI|nr:hypothetical protein CDL12_15750 [Handroanthus impetiginosus]
MNLLETLVADIINGRWYAILPQVTQLKPAPRKKLENLSEQVLSLIHEYCMFGLSRGYYLFRMMKKCSLVDFD